MALVLSPLSGQGTPEGLDTEHQHRPMNWDVAGGAGQFFTKVLVVVCVLKHRRLLMSLKPGGMNNKMYFVAVSCEVTTTRWGADKEVFLFETC